VTLAGKEREVMIMLFIVLFQKQMELKSNV